jgi:hypothetical protein
MQAGFSGVGGAEKSELRGTLCTNHMRRSAALATFLRARKLFGQLLDARLDVRLQVFRTLVLRDRPEHFTQAIETLFGLASRAIGLFSLLEFGRGVGRHDPLS